MLLVIFKLPICRHYCKHTPLSRVHREKASPLCVECSIIEDAVHIMAECVRNEDIGNDMMQITQNFKELTDVIQLWLILSQNRLNYYKRW